MRMLTTVLASVCCVGAAHANPYDDPVYDAADYAATAYYRVDFGYAGGHAPRHLLGLKMANERADAQGAPALLRAEWAPSGALAALSITGLELGRTLLVNRANGSNDDALVSTEVEDPSCTGIGSPRADCVREGWKREVHKASWFKSTFGDLSWPELITAAAAIGIVVAGAVSAGSDDAGPNTGASP